MDPDINQVMQAESPKTMSPGDPEAIVFRARIRPNRPLDRRGQIILFTCVILLTTVLCVPFYLLGALPVVGFFGLDLVLLWIAFRVSNQRAQAYEELVLTRIELLFRRVSWRGRISEWRFNPRWVRLSSEEHAEFGMQRLALVEGRRLVEMAAFLGAEEKADFADALKQALAAARRG
jgi:uncharacterized membrane protein